MMTACFEWCIKGCGPKEPRSQIGNCTSEVEVFKNNGIGVAVFTVVLIAPIARQEKVELIHMLLLH